MDQDKKQAAKELRLKIQEQTIGYITAALGLVAGLAWNDAVKTMIEEFYPVEKGNGVLAKFWYATVITLVIVIISYYLLRFINRQKEEVEKEK